MTDEPKIRRILIFDDDSDLRKLVSVYITKLFPGVDAVEYDPLVSGAPDEDFDWSKYDVLILDYFLCLHGVTGLDIMHRNRNNTEFPATIMLTGAGNEEVAVKALKAGVYDYLRKQSLDKKDLHDSILKAFKAHKQTKQQKQEITHQGRAFSKSLFYQQLEFRRDRPEYRDRVLVLIELDNHRNIAESEGVIHRDNIIKHIAKHSFAVFSMGDCNPSVTRLSDSTIALLIDMPDSIKTLDFNLKGLLTYLEKRPYKFDDKKINFSVSVGAVQLLGDGESRDIIIGKVKNACSTAAEIEGNSFFIFGTASEAKVSQQPAPSPPEPKQIQELPEITPEPASKSGLELEPAKADEPKPTPVIPPASNPVASESRPEPTEARPKKSLAQLKAEMGMPKTTQHGTVSPDEQLTTASKSPVVGEKPSAPSTATQTPPTPSTVSQNPVGEVELDESSLDEAARKLKKAFDEQRVIRAYQPVITLLNEDMESDDEIHSISLQQVDEDGSITPENKILAQLNTPEFQKFVDHWLLREVIGTLTNKKKTTDSFIVKISDASLADAGFFTWLKKLLTGLDTINPGKYIALQINSKDLATLEKQANALIAYLRKSHNFKFVLGEVNNVDDVVNYADRIKFDYIRCSNDIIKSLQSISVDPSKTAEGEESPPNSQLDLIKSKGASFIAENIENATELTEAITCGVEYAMGEFIGEPVTQLEDMTSIESFEIV